MVSDPIRRIYVGLQWGDEGKGKLVDEAVDEARARADNRRTLVARFQGGPNAGHTMYIRTGDGLEEFVTHAAPSGLAHNVDVAMGPHFAFDPEQFLDELNEARERFGYNGRVLISGQAGVLLPHHRMIDEWQESKGEGEIGTTKSGMGPFYEDCANRTRRIRFSEYVSDEFPDRLREVFEDSPALDSMIMDTDSLLEQILAEHEHVREELQGFEENLEYRMRDYIRNGDHVIVEGAQGTMLDVDWGDQPNVTSSHLTAGSAFSRLALPLDFDVYGVEKVYPTRVGGGILPTHDEELSRMLQENAGEEGATTGRPRRAGWPDWAAVRRSARLLNDCDGIYLTRVDCVQDVDLKPGLAYEVDGEWTSEMPGDLRKIDSVLYGDTYNWNLWEGRNDLSDPEDVHQALELERAQYVAGGFNSFPRRLQEYVLDHNDYVGVPVVGVSIGPARGETVREGLPD